MIRAVLLPLLLVSTAYAGKPPPNIAVAGAAAGAKAGAISGSHSSVNNRLTVNVKSPESRILPNVSAAGGRGGIGQGGNATGGNATTGDSSSDQQQSQDTDQANSQTVNAGPEGNINDTYEDYVSAAYAPSVQPTVPCMLPINGGIVLPALGSLSAGSGTIDVECERREAVRIGLASRDPQTQQMANQVMQNMLAKMLEPEPGKDEVAVTRIKGDAISNYDSLFGE